MHKIEQVCHQMQKWGFLGGQEKRELSFAGPSFSVRPKNLHPTSPTSLSLPPRPHGPPVGPPLQPQPKVCTTTSSTTVKPITKTRKHLLAKAKRYTAKFLGKFNFGTNGDTISVLPPLIKLPPTQRDLAFIQGKYKINVVSL